MRKWKKCLLLAAGMAAALSTAAMASQAKAGDSDTVTVEVKNCKGGAIVAYYEYVNDDTEENYTEYLPIGEKSEIPKGVELRVTMDPISYYSEIYDDVIDSVPKTLSIKENGEETIYPSEYDSIEAFWTAENDCVLSADCVAKIEVEGYGDDDTSLPDSEKNYLVYARSTYYTSPEIVEVNVTSKLGSKNVALSSVPEFKIGSPNPRDNAEWYLEHFEITKNGFRSKDALPLGKYRIPYMYKRKANSKNAQKRYATVYVGRECVSQGMLAQFMDEDYLDGFTFDETPVVNPEYTEVDTPTNTYHKHYFDAAVTSVGDLIKLVYETRDTSEYTRLAGYEYTGEYVDRDGQPVDVNDTRLLRETAGKRYAYFVNPVLKKGNKTYKPIDINLIPDNEVILRYTNSWITRNGKLYYYGEPDRDEDNNFLANNMIKDSWVRRGGQDVYVDKTGALVTDGIAGREKNDESGLWLVDSKGYKRTGYSNENYEVGMNAYTIVDGKVTDIRTVPVKTPSNAEKVQKFTDGLEIAVNNSNLDEQNKKEYASMLTTGINGLDDQQKNNLHDTVIEKADEALKSIYGTDKATVECDSSSVETAELEGEKISAKGLIAAAGSKDGDVKLKITQTASDAIMKFDAKLYVGDSEDPTQLKSPVILDIEIPEDVQEFYSKYGYTYKLVHVGDGKTESVGDGKTKNGLSLELSQDMTSMRIRTSSFSTFELQAVRKTSDDSTVTPGEPEKPTKPNEPEKPTKPNEPEKPTKPSEPEKPTTPSKPENPTTPETPNKPSNDSSSSSDSDDSGSSSSGSSYRRTKSSPSGQWVQDAKGWWYRRADGSWPKSQWIELGWNGVNSWYYFNESGYMVTGWREDGGYTYYLNPVSDGTRGQMFTGWHQIDSIWYYFNKLTGGPQGSLVKNATTPDGYKVGADGAWLQ